MADVTYQIAIAEDGTVRNIGRQDMAKEKMFTWLVGDTYTRSREGRGGRHLVRGESYDVAGFSPAVVEEWVRSGAAKYADGKKAAETK